MKNATTILTVFVFMALTTNATVTTVNNYQELSVQFPHLQTANKFINANDTLNVNGFNGSQNPHALKKEIHSIVAGTNNPNMATSGSVRASRSNHENERFSREKYLKDAKARSSNNANNNNKKFSREKYIRDSKARSSNNANLRTLHSTPKEFIEQKGVDAIRIAASVTDSLALIDLYNSTDGDSWYDNTNWLSNSPIEDWYGVDLWGEDKVKALSLDNNNLVGQIPTSIGDLTSLVVIEVGNNQLSGSIPASLWNILTLEWIWMGNNQFTGDFPLEIVQLASLHSIGLHDNQITGTLPANIGDLTQLEYLELANNQLTGSIPASAGNCTQLLSVNLGDNQFTGEIPVGFWNIPTLTNLSFYNNQFTGVFPTSLSNLPNIEAIHIGGSSLTGTIPSDIGSLSNLIEFSIWGNQLSGTIPTSLWQLSSLRDLDLGGNNFEGTITSQIGNLSSLKSLFLYWNQFEGELPVELWGLTNLETLYLTGNAFTGNLPSDIGSLTQLKYLELGNNQLSGTLPLGIGNLSQLESLDLSNNQLSGPIPADLWNITTLEWLWMGDNQFTGVLPAELTQLVNIHGMGFHDNQLTGTIPVDIGNLTLLEHLELANNQFLGSIPASLGNLTQLKGINFGDNQLTGEIPAGLWNNSGLEYIYLYNNQFTGVFPSSLANLPNLEVINIGGSNLTGTLPSDIGGLTNLIEFCIWGSQLTGTIPTSLWQLTNLVSLDLGGNNFEGTIPGLIGNLTHLKYLHLWWCGLGGELPIEIWGLTDLQLIALDGNNFSGSIPSQIGNLTDLWYFDLSRNQFSGSIPGQIGNLSNLIYLYLGQNQFTGIIPTEIGNLTNLRKLELQWNQFVSPLPTEICDNLLDLERLNISRNNFGTDDCEVVQCLYDRGGWEYFNHSPQLDWFDFFSDCNWEYDNNLGIASLVLPDISAPNYSLCQPTANETIAVKIYNSGINPVSDYSVSFDIDGVTIATEQGAITIPPGDTIVHTFSTTADLSSNDYYRIFDLDAYVDYDLDDFEYNNSFYYYIQTFGDYTDEPGWTSYNSCDGMLGNTSYSIAEDGLGNIWTTNQRGASKFDGTSWTTYTTDDGLSENYSWALHGDSQGNMWFSGSSESAITVWDGTSFTIMPTNGVFEECIYEDVAGNLWFGSYNGDGVAKWDGSNWTYYPESVGNFGNGIVESIAEDVNGNMYFSCGNNGLVVFDGSTWQPFLIPNNTEYISEIFFDSQGNTWFGTFGNSYYKYDGTNWTVYTDPDRHYITDITEDINGAIWFANSYYEMISFDGTTWNDYTVDDGFAVGTSRLWAIHADSQGDVWSGSSRVGISRYSNANITPIHNIQYTSDPSGDSPYNGQTITTTGIVTAIHNSGYFIQDGEGEWNGIYVYDNSNTPSIGDEISLTAEVYEYYNMTELKNLSAYSLLSVSNPLPESLSISTLKLATNEANEGVLIQIPNAVCVDDANLNGEWELNDGSGNALIDDGIFAYSPTLGYFYNVTGVVYYSFGSFRLFPRDINDIIDYTSQTTVTFNVNMNNKIGLNEFNPETDFVDLAGTFNTWGNPGDIMLDVNSDGIYTVVKTGFTVNDYIEFKFRINGDWNTAEFPGGSNRTYTIISSNDVLDFWYNDEQLPSFALNFDGIEDRAMIDNINIPSGDFTAEAWIKPYELTGVRQMVIFLYDELGSTQFGIETDGSIYYGEWVDSESAWHYLRTYNYYIPANGWSHIAVTKESDLTSLYINGVKLQWRDIPNSPSPDNISIGWQKDQNNRYFDGLIDEVRIWTIARAESEIASNMYNYLIGDETGLHGYYKMNSGNGQELFDSSPSSINGYLGETPNPEDKDPVWTSTDWPYSYAADLSIVGINQPKGPAPSYSLCQPTNGAVSVVLTNNGITPVSNFNINCQLDGVAIATETVTSTINPGDTIVYDFNATVNLASTDYYKAFPLMISIEPIVGENPFGNIYNWTIKTFGDYTDEPGWESYNSCDGMLSDISFDIAEDGQGNIWSTDFYGASMFDGTSWTTYTTADGLGEDYNWDLLGDSQGNVWFAGSNDSTITVWDGTSFTVMNVDGIFEESIYEDENGNFWFGAYNSNGGNSIAMYDGTSWTYFHESVVGSAGRYLHSVGGDINGNIYIGFGDGIVIYDGTNWSAFTIPNTTSNSDVSIYLDSQGNTWFAPFGTKYYKYDGSTWTEYTDISNHYVSDISEDINGTIWFANYYYELQSFDGTNWAYYTVNEGFAVGSGRICAVYADSQGKVWGGSRSQGISVLNLNSLISDFTADVTSGDAPLTVQFTDLSTGNPTNWEWDFENDGTIDSYVQNPQWTFTNAGIYTVSLTVSDGTNSDNETKADYITVSVAGDHFVPVWTGNPYQPMTILLSSATLDGNNFSVNDEIGVFDVDASANEICVGFGTVTGTISTGTPLTITVSANDPSTSDVDGFTSGHTIIYRAWDDGAQQEFTNYQATYDGSLANTFIPLGTALAEVTFISSVTQNIELNTGWNIMSFYVTPDDMDMITILDPLVTSSQLIKVINEAGGFIQFIPGVGWMNTIGDMANTEGYYIKVNTNTSFEATGMSITAPFNISLSTGWNIMSYPFEQSQDAEAALQSLIDANQLIKVINEAGGFIQYIPGVGWMNTIGNFDADEGYYIKVNANTSLNFGGSTSWQPGDPFEDTRDGQTYNTVLIGDQCWMAENLNVGIRIDGGNFPTDNGIIEKYCSEDNEGNCTTYGGLYFWDEMMKYDTEDSIQGICPIGWHIPSKDEWLDLRSYLGGSLLETVGGKMKESGTTHWFSPNTGATNESGFTGLPGGTWFSSDGLFLPVGSWGCWWSSSEWTYNSATDFNLRDDSSWLHSEGGFKSFPYSVRCIKD